MSFEVFEDQDTVLPLSGNKNLDFFHIKINFFVIIMYKYHVGCDYDNASIRHVYTLFFNYLINTYIPWYVNCMYLVNTFNNEITDHQLLLLKVGEWYTSY